jgi:hypothetical protein
MAEFC